MDAHAPSGHRIALSLIVIKRERHESSSSIVNVINLHQSCTSSIAYVIYRHQLCTSSIVSLRSIRDFDSGFVNMCHKPAASLQGRMTPQSKGTLHKHPVSREKNSRCSQCTLLLHAEPTLPIGHGICHPMLVSAHRASGNHEEKQLE